MMSVWMESRFYWGIEPRQWPADVDGTPNVSRVRRQDESLTASFLFFLTSKKKLFDKFKKKTHKMKTEIYIKKNGPDNYDFIKGSLVWERCCSFQINSWIADEATQLIQFGARLKKTYKITIEEVE